MVYGKVHGNITALERIELKASAEVIGDIKTKMLSIEAGAIFVGRSTVGTPAQAPAQAQTPTPAQTPAPAPAQASAPAQGQQAAKPAVAGAPKQATLPGAI